MVSELKRGWDTWDEGTLAESGERVLRGNLLTADYHEGYTRGLDYLNAAAFRLFGTNLASMRYGVLRFLSGLGLGSLLCRFKIRPPGCECPNTACYRMGPSQLCCSHAVLVQPVLRHFWLHRLIALHQETIRTLAAAGRLVFVATRFILREWCPVVSCIS